MKRVINLLLLIFMTAYLLLGCTLEAQSNKTVSRALVKGIVQDAIDSELDKVLPELEKENPGISRQLQGYSSREIVAKSLSEENGEEYLDFTYSVLTADDSDEVVNKAKALLPEEEYNKLLEDIHAEEMKNKAIFEARSKYLTREEQIEFYDELQDLIVKTIVLLTAALVYAFIPKVMLWGKVSAACAISIAAGIVAGGIMSFVSYYQLEEDSMESFEEWMTNIFDDSYSHWAIATGMLVTASAISTSPVAQAVILGTFALFGVFKEAGPLLRKYDIGQ